MRHDLSLIEPMAPGSQLDAKNNPIQVFHCYGSVKMIRFSYSSEDTKDKERRKGWVVDRRLNVVPSAKRCTPVPGPRHTIRQRSSIVYTWIMVLSRVTIYSVTERVVHCES
jgi:hypothetical protein